MSSTGKIIVALSGGVDSAVAAVLLQRAGYTVECLHMSNWEDDGYCDNAREFQHARQVCAALDVPLHRVNFAKEYRDSVFEDFLADLNAGFTPNPDVLCNREIKFGVLRSYARRLGAQRLATGHYARLESSDSGPVLRKGRDPGKDQSYFLHAVERTQFENVLFPLGELHKSDVRRIASESGLSVAQKKDSTGICFIGERPFTEFLSQWLPARPGPIVTPDGTVIGEHRGLAFYTLGQRQGLAIGGQRQFGPEPWYVAAKRSRDNALVVVQGTRHPALYSESLVAESPNWLSATAASKAESGTLRCTAKTRYRQADQAASVARGADGRLDVHFEAPQRAVTPGQFIVFYEGERCLGGARILSVAASRESAGCTHTATAVANVSRAEESSLI